MSVLPNLTRFLGAVELEVRFGERVLTLKAKGMAVVIFGFVALLVISVLRSLL